MTRRVLYTIADPEYESCIFFTRCFAGLKEAASRYDLGVVKVHAVADLPHDGVDTCALFCSEKRWAGQTIRALSQRGIRSVLAGAQPDGFSGVSGTIIDRWQLVEDMVRYMVGNGRKRLACLGVAIGDINDAVRVAAFHNAMRNAGLHTSESDVFTVSTDTDKSVLRMLQHAQDYDGVLCVNDQVAVRLIAHASAMGIRVPEDLFVSGSGNLLVGQMIHPTLTTTDLDYYQMGRKTVDIMRYIDRSSDSSVMTVKIEHRLLPRGSTAFMPLPKEDAWPATADFPQDNDTDETKLAVERMENCLYHCDGLDLCILSGIVRGHSLETIASDRFVSLGTVNYRAKKLYGLMGVSCRRDLQSILKRLSSDADALSEMAKSQIT